MLFALGTYLGTMGHRNSQNITRTHQIITSDNEGKYVHLVEPTMTIKLVF
jgi:hypothetical protein